MKEGIFIKNDNNTPTQTGGEAVNHINTPVDTPYTEVKETATPTQIAPPKAESNLDRFISHTSKPRQEVAEPPKPEPISTIEEAVEEVEEPQKAKLNKSGIEAGANFFTELGDLIFPQLAAFLNEEPAEDFELKSKERKMVYDAYVRKMEESQKNMSANGQLMSALAVGYGIPLGMGAFLKIAKIFKERNEIHAPPIQQEHPQQQTSEQVVEVTPQQQSPLKHNKIEKVCSNDDCGNKYESGKGFGKSKNSKSYDKYCTNKCMHQQNGRGGGRTKKVKK